MGAASSVTKSGERKLIAVASARGTDASAMKYSVVEVSCSSERAACVPGLRERSTANPWRGVNSSRMKMTLKISSLSLL